MCRTPLFLLNLFFFQILSNILSHMTISDLKILRFTSKSWNTEGFKHLKKQYQLKLYLSSNKKTSRYGLILLQYANELKGNYFPKLYLYDAIKQDDDGNYPQKVVQDLDHFFFNTELCYSI